MGFAGCVVEFAGCVVAFAGCVVGYAGCAVEFADVAFWKGIVFGGCRLKMSQALCQTNALARIRLAWGDFKTSSMFSVRAAFMRECASFGNPGLDREFRANILLSLTTAGSEPIISRCRFESGRCEGYMACSKSFVCWAPEGDKVRFAIVRFLIGT